MATIVLFGLPACTAAQTRNNQQLVDACTRINHDYALARDHADKKAYADLFTNDADPSPPITKFMVFMGEYHDEYKLTADGCKFSRRETKPLFTGETDQ